MSSTQYNEVVFLSECESAPAHDACADSSPHCNRVRLENVSTVIYPLSAAADSNKDRLPIIHMFWHGAPLSRVERLCMSSFVAQGHALHLHVYDEPSGIPLGVQLVDATKTLARELVFRHPKTQSLAQFADWFRYRVLLAEGGIWADTDVVCLKPLRFKQSEVFAWQDDAQINNAILGLSAAHPLAQWMATCCEFPNRLLPYDDGRSKRRKLRRRFLEGNRRGNVKWGEFGPVGFTQAARHLGYADRAMAAHHFYAVPFKEWRRVFDATQTNWDEVLAHSEALHLWNEMMRREAGFDKNARFPRGSLYERLCARYLCD